MKIFISIKQKWLQHRVYKYTLKYQDYLSKSDSKSELSKSYREAANDKKELFGASDNDFIYYCKLCQKYQVKSAHYEHLAEIYLSKKFDLEEELQYLTYRKA